MPDFSLKGLSALIKGRLGRARYSPQIAAALALAYRGHDGLYREQADPRAKSIPYIVHPVGVALLAEELMPLVEIEDEFDDVIAACLTHDLLEDTEVSTYDLERGTSARTLELVVALSKPSSGNYLSREARNSALLDSIRSAGKTAVFIKICDNLHNLSRPKQTPLGLLKKTVEKGRTQYIGLLECADWSTGLLAHYEPRLSEVEKLISQARFEQLVGVGNDGLNAVFAYCRERTKRKLLEPHDVIDIIKEITGAHDVLYTSLKDLQVDIGLEAADAELRDLSISLKHITDGDDVPIDAWPARARSRLGPAKRIIAIKTKAVGQGAKFYLVLLGPEVPSWISGTVSTVLVSYLSRFLNDAGHPQRQTLELAPI